MLGKCDIFNDAVADKATIERDFGCIVRGCAAFGIFQELTEIVWGTGIQFRLLCQQVQNLTPPVLKICRRIFLGHQ